MVSYTVLTGKRWLGHGRLYCTYRQELAGAWYAILYLQARAGWGMVGYTVLTGKSWLGHGRLYCTNRQELAGAW